jgi:hypothetical protein
LAKAVVGIAASPTTAAMTAAIVLMRLRIRRPSQGSDVTHPGRDALLIATGPLPS